jgi:YHS domain-containing protein
VAAPFQDSHDGRVFFFAGKDTYEAFRVDPDKYVPPRRPTGADGERR